MPELVMVDKMTNSPGHCLLCGNTPKGDDGEILPAIHVQGLDVNWGEDVYVCQVCAGLMADLFGRPSTEKVEKVESRIVFEKRRADTATGELAEARDEIETLTKAKEVVRKRRKQAQEEAAGA